MHLILFYTSLNHVQKQLHYESEKMNELHVKNNALNLPYML